MTLFMLPPSLLETALNAVSELTPETSRRIDQASLEKRLFITQFLKECTLQNNHSDPY